MKRRIQTWKEEAVSEDQCDDSRAQCGTPLPRSFLKVTDGRARQENLDAAGSECKQTYEGDPNGDILKVATEGDAVGKHSPE
jgi:hypothetical protein